MPVLRGAAVTMMADGSLAGVSYDRVDLAEFDERVRAMIEAKLPVGFDVETSYPGESREGAALHAEENYLVSYQFTNSLEWARMLPLAFDAGPNVDNRKAAALMWQLHNAVDDEGLPLGVAHGGGFAELRWMCRFFLRNLWDHPLFGKQVIKAKGRFPLRSDTMLESYAEGENHGHGLKPITLANAGHQMIELGELLADFLGKEPTSKQKKSIRFSVFDQFSPKVIAYACEDALWCLWHHLRRFGKLRSKFIYKTEMAVLPVIADMADEGVCYDWNLLRDKAREARDFGEKLLGEVMEDFAALSGQPLKPEFNFNSSPQLSDLLYNQCGMKATYFTKGGKPSVDAKHALPELAKKYPEVKKYLAWKRLDTLRNNFLDGYEAKYSWAADGRAHPALLQHGTIAGRFSCQEPNYQQSPGEYHLQLRDGTRFDFNFREAIVAPPPAARPWWELVLEEAGWTPPPPAPEDELGWYLIGFDYSQIELRVLAAEAGETALLEAFMRGDDVHSLTAALMLGKPLAEVSRAERKDTGKRMNFAIGYQMSAKGLAEQMGITIEAAESLFAQFHAAYPRLAPYTARVVREARRLGYVRTKWGRKVIIWEYERAKQAENQRAARTMRAAGDRTAGNAPIQGPATGEYVKVAMVRAVKAIEKAGLSDVVKLFMNVHDALEFAVRKDITPAQVIRLLQPAVVYEVPGSGWPPMVADWHIAKSWGEQVDVELLPDGTVRRKRDDDEPRPAPAVRQERPAAPPAPETAPAPPAAAEVGGGDGPPGDGGGSLLPDAAGLGGPRRVVISVRETPGSAAAHELLALLKTLPGDNTVVVETPDGPIELKETYGLAPAHEGAVSVVLGGAAVHYALDSVDLDALARDVAL